MLPTADAEKLGNNESQSSGLDEFYRPQSLSIESFINSIATVHVVFL